MLFACGDKMGRLKVIVEYIVLGIVQGISEMLPISSSGHMKIVKELLNISNNDLSLEILFHLASLLSLCIFFAPTLKKLMVNNYLYIVKHKREYKGDFKYLLCLCIASIPAGIVGILLKDKIELLFSDVRYVGISLIVTSLILYITYKLPSKNKEITYKSSFVIGLFQGVGIIPGISRSGVTYLGAKGVGVENKKASEFIFLMLIPVTFGSFLFSFDNIVSIISVDTIIPCIVGFIVSFIFTYLSLSLFSKVMVNKRILVISGYCFLLGVITILFL